MSAQEGRKCPLCVRGLMKMQGILGCREAKRNHSDHLELEYLVRCVAEPPVC